ncbi:phospholipase D-like domain-containing protein [Halomarina rubra]|uniref:Phosphatidylserine/phosphatidylglycerophosphate/ cardiolipin synthase family protein n=1 Tax=Halomarina rubra TaxID=2071873 RepID=A0ABD6AUM9_9EURY|nr:phospholipase D family protein [Halomarina rubra]
MGSDHAKDGASACEDFSIAEVLRDTDRVASFWEWFADQSVDVWVGKGTELFESLDDVQVDSTEQEAFLIGLLLNDAATRTTSGSSLRHSEYQIRVEQATDVLYQQLVATRVLEQRARTDGEDETVVEILATVPAKFDTSRLSGPRIGPLAPRLRSMLLEAKQSVRIANPYFDAGQRILRDVVALPRKGVETRLLTRETDHAEHRTVLNEMYHSLSTDQRYLFNVRELYELDDAGYQTTATHAKIVVVDDTVAYVGSANFTATSLTSNFELGVKLRGPPVKDVAAVFDEVYRCSRRVKMPIG